MKTGYHLNFGEGLTKSAGDDAVRRTFLGQAHIAGTGPKGVTCRGCRFWHQWKREHLERVPCLPGYEGGKLKRARRNYPILNKANRLVPPTAPACRLYQPAEVVPDLTIEKRKNAAEAA